MSTFSFGHDYRGKGLLESKNVWLSFRLDKFHVNKES